MNPYAVETPPITQTEDGRVLAEYLDRQLTLIRDSIASAYNWQESYTFDGKPRNGMMRYSDGSSAPFTQGAGFYYFSEGNWYKIADLAFVVDNFVLAGYGGINLSTSRAGSNIGGAWQTVIGYDSGTVTTPRYVVQDVANDGLVLDIEGIWLVSVYFTISHNEVNSGRTMEFRFYNNDTATGGREIAVGTGRNVGVTTFSASFLSEIAPADINDLWQIQVRSGDSYSSVSWLDQEFSVHHVSNYTTPFGV